jgi:hypothetical protein
MIQDHGCIVCRGYGKLELLVTVEAIVTVTIAARTIKIFYPVESSRAVGFLKAAIVNRRSTDQKESNTGIRAII